MKYGAFDSGRLDRHLGAFIAGMDDSETHLVRSVAESVGHAVLDGAVCLDLADWQAADSDPPIDPDSLYRRLEASPVVGRPGDRKPLILDAAGRLYLYRFWKDETTLAGQLLSMASAPPPLVDEVELANGLSRHFPHPPKDGEPDWQAVAAAVAVLRRLTVISGGPGTGKTHTISRIMALLAEQAGPAGIRIALAAPTGKAAVRLRESVGQYGQYPHATLSAMTIHRLLGVQSGKGSGRASQERPIRADVVVVDEASMISLPLLAQLVRRLGGHARLILVGDHHQLASVSPGAVLGDLCAPGPVGFTETFARRLTAVLPHHPDLPRTSLSDDHRNFGDGLVMLERSYRFSEGGSVDRLRRAILAGDGPAVIEAIDGHDDCYLHDSEEPHAVIKGVIQAAESGYGPLAGDRDLKTALDGLDRFRILTATRSGLLGVEGLNSRIIPKLIRAGKIRPRPGLGSLPGPGTPVMITRNDYRLGLFNGDSGILWEGDDASDTVIAAFPTNGPDIRRIAAVQLPSTQPAFAVTVHKSQGSEYDEVHLVLPSVVLPLVSRELLYTAVTRARGSIRIWAGIDVLHAAVRQRIRRRSGLGESLWGSNIEMSRGGAR